MAAALKMYLRDRLFEWAMTLAMLGLGIQIAIWQPTIGASAFRLMLAIVSSRDMATVFLLFGILRIAALIANGSWPVYGPRLRAACAGVAALMWGQMFAALLLLAPFNNGIPSPGIPVYFAITIGELISAYRAMSDERTSCR